MPGALSVGTISNMNSENNTNIYNTIDYNTTVQGVLPIFFSEDALSITDPVIKFNELISKLDLDKYLNKESDQSQASDKNKGGRPSYDERCMLKTVLYAFMEKGYASLRKLEDNCRVNLRYMYLMKNQCPSYKTFNNFINNVLKDSVEDIFYDLNAVIFKEEQADLDHIYIDGTKLEANANKYTWVWKKATEKNRYKLFGKISKLFTDINADLKWSGLKLEVKEEYVPDELAKIVNRLKKEWDIDESKFVKGKGHRKTGEQRWYEELIAYHNKLVEYVEKIAICGTGRNSYSKTDKDATFMRIKKDYMGNDQLLPAYNIQIGVADEYIAVIDVYQYRSDMDAFIPLMEAFHEKYGFYPRYPVADAGYGSFNNYIYCETKGMEKYMKFPMYKKETTDRKYHENPYRAENFKIDDKGNLRCPNDKIFRLKYRQTVKGNQYGRQEEVYECEDCSGCPYAAQCKKTTKNRTVRINEELTRMHKEVLENLESIQGALLRMNRSIQAEGTFGIMKNDRSYDRIVRRGMKSVRMEIFLVAIGHNVYKWYNKFMRTQKTQEEETQEAA